VEPQVVEPQVVELQVVEPQVVELQVVELQVVEPQVVEPQVVELQVVELQVVEPQVVEPQVAELQVVEPQVVETQATQMVELGNLQYLQVSPLSHPADPFLLSTLPLPFLPLSLDLAPRALSLLVQAPRHRTETTPRPLSEASSVSWPLSA